MIDPAQSPPALVPSVRAGRPVHRPVTRDQRPDDPPLRLGNMKDSTEQNELNKRERPDGDETLAELMSSYTPEQRRLILKGLRIWARVAIRSYMREHGAGSLIEDGGEEESR